MTAPSWYTITALSRATGLEERYIRQLLDDDRIYYLQPGGPATKRLLNARTVADLEQLGIPVHRHLLNDEPGNLGSLGKPGEAGRIRCVARESETIDS